MAPIGQNGIVLMGANVHSPVPSPFPGHAFFFALFVRDNGEGSDAPPDQILFGFLVLPDFLAPADMCQAVAGFEASNPGAVTGGVEAFFSDVEQGNLQVRW